MADPNQGYPPQDPYAQQQSPMQPGFDNAGSPPPTAGGPPDVGGKKKKRGYAQQAYDFGGNAALGGQAQGGGQFQQAGAPAPAYGGFQQQEAQPLMQPQYGQPAYGAQPGAPVPGAPAPYGSQQPQYAGGVSGYQAPDAGYPGPGAAQAGVAGITAGMGQVGFGGAPPPAIAGQPQQAGARPAVLNQLYPTDLLNQPFNVAELDLPPPPIILPPNVSFSAPEIKSLLIKT